MTDENNANPVREIYAIGGLAMPPEASAYGLAKYSRSSKMARETFSEMTEKMIEGGESVKKFFETFYFKYGHASIADLAHVSIALDNISMVAAIDVVDEVLWDGQERSTRYQKYTPESICVPKCLDKNPALKNTYNEAVEELMEAYLGVYKSMLKKVRKANPLTEGYPEGPYKASTRARAFDIARYMLPMGMTTSVGQITSGRTLEKMISRLYSSEYQEVRDVADDLKKACQSNLFNPYTEEITASLDHLEKSVASESEASEKVHRLRKILAAHHPLPTLVKYTAPMEYMLKTKEDLTQAAKELLKIDAPDSQMDVQAFMNQDPIIEAVTTMLYWVTHYSYAQIKQQVESWDRAQQLKVFELGTRHRGKHDELLRVLDTHSVTFDILMDIGSYRDMHRHRKTVQVPQAFTHIHGYDGHPELEKYGALEEYTAAMDAHAATMNKIFEQDREAGVYIMPMGYKCRSLFKMGWSQIDYMGKLRTGKGRHQSYWQIALRMVEEAAKLCPERATLIETTPLFEDSVYER